MKDDYIRRSEAKAEIEKLRKRAGRSTEVGYCNALDKAIDKIPTTDVVTWEFLKRYAEHFCAIVSPEEFVREAKGFWEGGGESNENSEIT